MLTAKNLIRNKRRTSLTVLAIALPLFVFLATTAMKQQVEQTFDDLEQSMRVATHQKLTYTTQLPQRIRGEIEAIAPEGYLKGVCRATWFGGRIEGTQLSFPSMAVDRDTFHVVYHDYELTDEQVERFQNEKRAAVVGKQFAKTANVKVGDRITLKGSVPPFASMDFIIVGIPEGLRAGWLYFGLDYYDEVYKKLTGNAIGVHNFWMRCNSTQGRQWALQEIDRHFANSQNETRTEMESTFIRSFIESGGDWVGLAFNVGCMVVFVALMVAFNTMSMSFRERISEIAVLRALGFSSGRIVLMVLSEGLVLGIISGLIAVGPVLVITRLYDLQIPGMGSFAIDAQAALLALLAAALCGTLAACVPAVMAGRLEVVSALRKVV